MKWIENRQTNPCLTSAWRVVSRAIPRFSHHWLVSNEWTGGETKGTEGKNQSSIHLTGGIRWFVLALWENPANMHLKVLARHLHPMTYPGHRTGVTTGSSTQPGESVQLLTPRNGMNHCGQKQRRSHRCHTGMHRMQISDCCWKNAALESRAIQRLKTEETVLKGSNWWNSALNSTGWPFIAK